MQAAHIKGVDNILADALSRDNLPLFRSLHSQADKEATGTPPRPIDSAQAGLDPGQVCGILFSEWISFIHSEGIQLSQEAVHYFLC